MILSIISNKVVMNFYGEIDFDFNFVISEFILFILVHKILKKIIRHFLCIKLFQKLGIHEYYSLYLSFKKKYDKD